jgi:hypothetical protein
VRAEIKKEKMIAKNDTVIKIKNLFLLLISLIIIHPFNQK